MISAFAFGGIPQSAVRRAFTESVIFVSPALLDEYRDVPLRLESEGKIDHVQLKALIAGIASFVAIARLVYPKQSFNISRDPKDDMILDCCYAANANYLVTGDKDLLEIEALPFDLEIISPTAFLDV